VVTNVDLDHHSEFASRAEVESLFAEWVSMAPKSVWGEQLEPVEFELAIRGEHNRQNAAVALAAVELAGFSRDDAGRVLREFQGAGRRLERRGEAGGVEVIDSYAHHPAEVAADIAAMRDGGRILVLFQPHLYSRTRHLAHDFGVVLASADVVAVTDVYRAREQPIKGVTGKLVVDAAAEARPGMELGWTPALEDGASFIARRARSGDSVLTLGAGDVDRAGALILEALA
jgi:UDP-N-acetylmuramate--alanine ligase